MAGVSLCSEQWTPQSPEEGLKIENEVHVSDVTVRTEIGTDIRALLALPSHGGNGAHTWPGLAQSG